MPKIHGAVIEHDGEINQLAGYQEITADMIFDIKLGKNFRRKARFFADGHKTETPASITYSTNMPYDRCTQ